MEERLKVLVAEDETILRKGLILTTDWKALGMVVIAEADNGIDAQELALKLEPDILVTDIAMPGMDGLELIGILSDQLPDCECIIISGHAQFSYAQKALSYGVKGYILKPIDPKELMVVLSKAAKEIYNRKQEREKDLELEQLRELSERFLPTKVSTTKDYRDQYIQKAITVIEQHYAEHLNVADIAEHMGLSERTLSNLFKERTGYTFLEYLTLYRMRMSTTLLQQKERQVGEVALMVGYKDYRYFCKIFKSCFGLTPLEFKKGGR